MSWFKMSLALGSMVWAVSSAWAQQGAAPASTAAAGGGAHTAQDVRFVMTASAAGITEILASQLAQTQEEQPAKVKAFAATMIDDHTRIDDELKGLAQKSGYAISTAPTPAQKASLARLRALHGKGFDASYAKMMVKDHREAVALFQAESTSGADPQLRAFAAQTLPILQHHLALANAL